MYEIPYSVTGTIKHTGLQEEPKDICKASYNGTWKATNVEDSIPMKHYLGETQKLRRNRI